MGVKNAEFDADFKSTGSKSASNSAFFEVHIENIRKKYYWGHISILATFEPNAQTAKKFKNIFINVL